MYSKIPLIFCEIVPLTGVYWMKYKQRNFPLPMIILKSSKHKPLKTSIQIFCYQYFRSTNFFLIDPFDRYVRKFGRLAPVIDQYSYPFIYI